MEQAHEQEAEIRARCERHAYGEAVELSLEVYGQELARFVMAMLHRRDLAEEACSSVWEKVLKNLERFRWQSSLRVWLYRIARNECMELWRSRAWREQPASQPVPADVAQVERSRTDPWLRTEVKEKFRALREQLSAHERALLQLKVDQNLPWTDVAEILRGEDEPPLTRRELEKRAVALRQQFKRLKARLKALALEAGLVPSSQLSGLDGR